MNKNERIGLDQSERGGAGVKMLLVLLVLLLIGHAGYNYIPVAYAGADLKQELQTAVVQGMAVARGEKPIDSVTKRVKGVIARSGFPGATVQTKEVNNVVQAHVTHTQKINLLPFGLYQYDYVINHTATPSGMLFDK